MDMSYKTMAESSLAQQTVSANQTAWSGSCTAAAWRPVCSEEKSDTKSQWVIKSDKNHQYFINTKLRTKTPSVPHRTSLSYLFSYLIKRDAEGATEAVLLSRKLSCLCRDSGTRGADWPHLAVKQAGDIA